MTGGVVVQRSYVHVEVGIARRKHAMVAARIKADDLHRFVLDLKPNFGFFMDLGTVRFVALIAQNVEDRLGDVAVDEKRKGLIDIDAALHCEGQELLFEAPLALDGWPYRSAAPI